jgi:hypothetical protein
MDTLVAAAKLLDQTYLQHPLPSDLSSALRSVAPPPNSVAAGSMPGQNMALSHSGRLGEADAKAQRGNFVPGPADLQRRLVTAAARY